MLNRKICYVLAMLLAVGTVYAQESGFSRGEELFRQNRLEDAIPYFEGALSEGGNVKAYEYLSLCYFSTGRTEQGFSISTEGMKVSGTDKKVLALNAGNAAFVAGDYGEAERWYSLSVSASSSYSAPVLNRANARLYQGKYQEAKADYQNFLVLEPEDYRKNDINAIISAIDEEIAFMEAQEAQRKAEEERIAAEEQRLAQEMARAEAAARAEAERRRAEEEALARRLAEEEAERKRKLLEEVAASLQEAETTSISAGAEDIIDYGYESELE